jgi:hypothetical protein
MTSAGMKSGLCCLREAEASVACRTHLVVEALESQLLGVALTFGLTRKVQN